NESGYVATEHQNMKIAAIEASFHTEPAPAPWTVVAIPGADGEPIWQFQIPFLGGLITTRSLTEELDGINELVDRAERRIRSGMVAYEALQQIRDDGNATAREIFERRWPDLGYGLLLKRYRDDVQNATAEQISQAAADTVPGVWPL